MKRFNILLLIFQLSFSSSFSQISKNYQKIISQYKELPSITIDDALKIEKSAIFIDTREYNEYKISHIQNSILLSFNNPNWNVLDKIPKNKAIIVYCSVGARSQNIGIKLRKKGFKNVHYCSTMAVSSYRITVQTIFFNDRLKVGRVTSFKKVYSNVQTFFMNLYEGESSENR